MRTSCSCNTGQSLHAGTSGNPVSPPELPYLSVTRAFFCQFHRLAETALANGLLGLLAQCFSSASLDAFGDKINCGINWLFKFTEQTTNCAGGLMMKPSGRSLASFSFTHFFMFE